VRELEKVGFDVIRGSHMTLHNPETDKTTLVGGDASLTDDEFRHFL
jgi:predicted RNA binding protein YcfA (HicA-like mRNA interferase family)